MKEVVPGLKVVLYGSQGPYSIQCHTLLPMISSRRSLALGHLKVPKLSTKGYLPSLGDCPPTDQGISIVEDRRLPRSNCLLWPLKLYPDFGIT